MATYTRDQLANAIKARYDSVKAAAEAALKRAGLPGVSVHSMRFRVPKDVVDDPCHGNCKPNEECVMTSAGDYQCIPEGGADD